MERHHKDTAAHASSTIETSEPFVEVDCLSDATDPSAMLQCRRFRRPPPPRTESRAKKGRVIVAFGTLERLPPSSRAARSGPTHYTATKVPTTVAIPRIRRASHELV
jgi:hypothetical protein